MINAAIVGAGRWGQRLVKSVQGKSGDMQFVAAVARTPSKIKEFADKAGLKVTDSLDDVLNDKMIDAIVLTTPHSQHHQEILAAAKAGKHVFVEKPVALTRQHAEEAVNACKASGVKLGIGFGRRFAPAFLELHRVVKAGQIGDILHIEAQFHGPTGYMLMPGDWRGRRSEAPSGGMAARGIHTIDAMIAIAGPVNLVNAISIRQKIEAEIDDTTVMLLRFANGPTGYQAAIFATGDYWRIQVVGTEGWAEMRGELSLVTSDLKGNTKTQDFEAADLERAILENFAQAVQTKGEFVITDAEAINGTAVLEAIPQSAQSGGPVEIA
jgi:predicted dehydrogenase